MNIIKLATLLLAALMLFSCSAQEETAEEEIDPSKVVTVPHATLSAIHIDTETGRDVRSKEEYIKADFRIQFPDGRETSMSDVNIRGRGNQSWDVPKKSYRLKFPNDIALISSSDYDNKDWLLIANHADKSMIRNITAYNLGRELDGIEWSPMSELVDVYLNGKHRGVYVLVERIETAKGRINIDEEGDSIGFLLEMDNYAEGRMFHDYFIVGPREYSIHSDFTSTDQVRGIMSHVTAAYDAAKNGSYSEIVKYIDLDSAIDMYLISEYMRNWDAGWSSCYMYVKEEGGPIFFGPPWDSDLSAGNTHNAAETNGLYVGNLYGMTERDSHNHVWYTALMTHDWFRNLVRDRWNEVKYRMADTVDNTCAYVYDNLWSVEHNFDRWDVLDTRINQEPKEVLKLKSCAENVDYMNAWLDERWQWLDSYYNSEAFAEGIIYNN